MTRGIRKDDHVMVIAGKDKGHVGRVVRVLPAEGRVMVDGAGRAKKHQRAGAKRATSGQQLEQGGIIDIELPVDVSNVQLMCNSCNRPTRIGHEGTGRDRIRVCRRCGGAL